MFPKFDYLFNIALVACLAFIGLFLGFKLSQLLGA